MSAPIPESVRRAAVADYKASGDSLGTVARKHGISKSALASWIKPKKRYPRKNYSECDGLTGGRWVLNSRGIKVWQPFLATSVAGATDQQRRVEWEDAMFTEDEAREAHRMHANGRRDPRTVVGERVYQRRKKRNQAARKRAAA